MKWVSKVIAIHKKIGDSRHPSSLYVNLPKTLAEQAGISEGDYIEISIRKKTIVLRKVR
jgi:antitoxin component of MazEF toxin-antitoxin module